MTTAAVAAPFRFFDLHVVRARRLGPSMVRITFGGRQLADFVSGGRDQRFKLFLPHPHQQAPLVPRGSGEDWFARWRAMDPASRAVMRTYTVRAQRRDPDEIDIDVVLHGGGPAARWAARARPGDPVVALGPVEGDNGGVDFRPPAGTDWVLVAADATALPAAEGILAWLPAGTSTLAWIEAPHAADARHLPTKAAAQITWLFREHDPAGLLVPAVRAARLPGGRPYAWIAGEAGAVRALRRHLVDERGFDRALVTFTGYWRRGASEEDLLAETLAGTGHPDG